MASDNTNTDLVLRTIQPESDITHSFFGSLAREIRDMIYDLIFQERRHPISFKDCKDPLENFYSETRTILPEVRLVSRRFKLEYDERDAYHLPKNSFRLCQDSSLDGPPGPISNCYGSELLIPTLAARTTVLHLDLECCRQCCRPKDGPERCLMPSNGGLQGIGGSEWDNHARHFYYDIAALPLLEKAYIHVSCRAAQGAVDSRPVGDLPPPLAKMPMLAQISTFRTVFVQAAPSQDDGIRSGERELWGASSPRSGGFEVRRQTEAIWTHVNGRDNGEKLERVRKFEMEFGPKGFLYF
jgi:hypothetical protein